METKNVGLEIYVFKRWMSVRKGCGWSTDFRFKMSKDFDKKEIVQYNVQPLAICQIRKVSASRVANRKSQNLYYCAELVKNKIKHRYTLM